MGKYGPTRYEVTQVCLEGNHSNRPVRDLNLVEHNNQDCHDGTEGGICCICPCHEIKDPVLREVYAALGLPG